MPIQTISDARQHFSAVEQYFELAEQPQSVAIAAAKAGAAVVRTLQR